MPQIVVVISSDLCKVRKGPGLLPCASIKRGQPFPRRAIHEPDVEGGKDGCRLNPVQLTLFTYGIHEDFVCMQSDTVQVSGSLLFPSPQASLMPSKSL
jgi:hypothetical protein